MRLISVDLEEKQVGGDINTNERRGTLPRPLAPLNIVTKQTQHKGSETLQSFQFNQTREPDPTNLSNNPT